MAKATKKPMGLGEILDQTFNLVKGNFVPFFIIMLILTGPYYLFSLLASFSGGTTLFREPVIESGNALNDFLNRFSGTNPKIDLSFLNLNAGMIIFGAMAGLLAVVIVPMARATIVAATERLQNDEPVHFGKILRRTFSRFWPLLGSSIVYGLCIAGILIGSSLLLLLAFTLPTVGIPIVIIVYIALILFLIYLTVRWSFYFPAVLFEQVAPGLGKSWQLTKGNFWRLVGIFIVISLVTSIIGGVINLIVGQFLGTSILSSVIRDLVGMVTNMIVYACYAVVYFDLCVRNDGDDLLDLIDSYEDDEPKNPVD